MIYRRMPMWAVLAGFAVTAVFVAGFFHESKAATQSASVCDSRKDAFSDHAGEKQVPRLREADYANRAAAKFAAPEYAGGASGRLDAVSFSVPANLFRRAGEFSCKVESVIKAYEDIDKHMKDFGGEITEMEITGNDDGRQGRISCTVSTDKFNPCITYLRGLGKVLSERITASARPKSNGKTQPTPDADEPDPRELSLISIQVLDERTAKEVMQSKGLLASSFHRSTSHFIAGLAVIVEGLGWIAPYLFIIGLLAAPIGVMRMLRRREQQVVPLEQIR